MSLRYQISYLLGIKPWDTGTVPQELRDLVEGPDAVPAGNALDLGCGTGTHAVYLAQRGWRVTAVDVVDRALRQARRKAAAGGVPVRWLLYDVARLGEVVEPASQRLLFDRGCFHGLSDAARDGYAKGIAQAAMPGALFLMWAVAPGPKWPLPRGVTAEEIGTRFAGWDIQWSRAPRIPPQNPQMARADPRWYLLKRRDGTGV